MPLRLEVSQRARHLGRCLTMGLSRLWAVVAVAVAFVGGSVLLAFAWGLRHLYWGSLVLVLVLLVVIIEGSYRESRRAEEEHQDGLAAEPEKLTAAGKAATDETVTVAKRRAILRSAGHETPDLVAKIERHHKHAVPGTSGIVLEVDYSVRNDSESIRGITPCQVTGNLYMTRDHAEDLELARARCSIEERRTRDSLPREVRPHETVRGFYVGIFPQGEQAHYELQIRDDFGRLYLACPPVIAS